MDIQITYLKNALEGWKEIILPLDSIMHWEKHWHPFSIVGSSTMFFLMVWLMDPSVLTTIALVGLTCTISDYFVPILVSSLLKSDQWTDKQEDKFDKICRSLIISKEKFSITYRSYILLRSTRPKMFYGLTLVSLMICAWIGNIIHNLLLIYMVVTFLFLVPGMEKRGILQKYGCIITDKIADLATNAKMNVSDLKKEK
ncbi:PREDICTED: ADP-ribosylation factor-like protein 6-interacting protein 1 isoform X2 [Nicrophorus vespilloides]|uniref:ADP-ribosylation factor-like protein 6-interacting protein 1 isoform X2 n=1 Tax=Nicrophorus vespilloides TaxID=110193 RepID=A0ABM1N1D7_NICVS|nr:PREDICTED: ADP-ribosylation factor-like protein 6-interacting protein 1 isoform X2 [Nicrophorus vespilloides]